ncbi:MAG: ABC transporter permease subunit, partial [Amphritea sp.]|nr:ABC transporter permease subunit [Amphritea sp.]
MSVLANRLKQPWTLIWLGMFVLAGVMIAVRPELPSWIFKYPREWVLPIKDLTSTGMNWIIKDASFGLFTVKELTRGIAWLIDWPFDFIVSLTATGFKFGLGQNAVEVMPSLSWVAVVAIFVAMAHYAKDWKLAALVGGCFLYIVLFGHWTSAMLTLSSIMIAVPIGVAGGVLLGILAYRHPLMERVLKPVLDLMQTMPSFAYLVPILFLYGFGSVSAMIATIIYAMPPMVRVTLLALRQVPSEINDFGQMVGSTRHQLMWKVLVPSAIPGLMVGVNQVIMLSLNMVIIASMIGAGGLGYDVLNALRTLDIGGGIETGLAIVALAIALDRLSYAFASERTPIHHEEDNRHFLYRHPYWIFVSTVILVTYSLMPFFPEIRSFPEAWTLGTDQLWSDLMRWININYFDQLSAFKNGLLLNVMLPLKRFLISLPWLWVTLFLTFLGYRLGRLKLALMIFGMCLFIVVNGLWFKAMVTIYLCGISVLVAMIFGVPLGIWAAQNRRAGIVISSAIDTLQTLPTFVYLIPVVMLFRVGDFSAMIAVVAYSLVPVIRYTDHGIRQVP